MSHDLARVGPPIRCFAFEEVQSDVQNLNGANDDVAKLLLHEFEVLAHHEVVVRHDEAGEDEVVEERDRDNQVEILELLVLGEDEQLAVLSEEFRIKSFVPRATNVLDLVIFLLGLLVALHHEDLPMLPLFSFLLGFF